MPTTRDLIPEALAALVVATGIMPEPTINEPEPSRWAAVAFDGYTLLHAATVQDEDTPETLAFVRGGGGGTEELELTLIIAYAVQIKPGAGVTADVMRAARRAQVRKAAREIADRIAANRTLGLGAEVYAEVGPPAFADEVPFPNALPCATALTPIRVLYTGDDAAS